MHYVASAAVVAALAAGAKAQGNGPTVTTPTSLVVCQPAQFSVSGGQAPYFISIIPGGQSAAAPLETLPDQPAAGSVTWNVDLAAGTSITVAVRDSTGALNYSQQVTIQPGSSDSCVGKNASASSGAVSAASAGASAASSASSAAGGIGASATSAASSARSAASSAVASASGAASSARASGSSSAAAGSTPASSAASGASSPSSSGSSSAGKVAATGTLGFVAAVFAALFA